MKQSICLPLLLLGAVSLINVPANAELSVSNPAVTTHGISASNQQAPTDESLIKLLKIMRMDDMMKAMTESQDSMMAPIMASIIDEMGLEELSDAQRQEFNEAFTRYSEQMLGQSNDDLLAITSKHFVAVAKNHYNQAEVDAQITFYSSDIGQSILDKQPKLMQEYMMAIMPDVLEVVSKRQERLLSQLFEDIEKIID